jgi:hypothetical protein
MTEKSIEFQPITANLIFERINGTNNGFDEFTFIFLAAPRKIEDSCRGSAASGGDASPSLFGA